MVIRHGRYWALAAASVVVVVYGSAQTTGALWRDDVAVAGGTLNSGTLDIKVGPDGAEVLIPAIANVLIQVRPGENRMVVRLPEGL